jgi:uncharacterized phage protein (TIGR01671 family)
MREILFRGKRIDNGEWVEGFYIQKPNPCSEDGKPVRHCIIDMPPFGYDVEPETVGQFTGLHDKNGKRIFEDDVVVCLEYLEYGNLTVGWDDGAIQLMREDTFYDLLDNYTSGFSIVIGNRWDNPDLLEVKK